MCSYILQFVFKLGDNSTGFSDLRPKSVVVLSQTFGGFGNALAVSVKGSVCGIMTTTM